MKTYSSTRGVIKELPQVLHVFDDVTQDHYIKFTIIAWNAITIEVLSSCHAHDSFVIL